MSLVIPGPVGEALAALPLINPYKADLQLTRMDAFLARLGHPQRQLPPVLHVAGTNGKGSTCAFLRAFLEAAGYRCHVTTSPHLVRVNERFRVNGALVSDSDLIAAIHACGPAIGDLKLSIFEFLSALAFWLFARAASDAAVLEVGLGGRLDATNVIAHCAAAGVARISLDHRDVLGPSHAAIAYEKAGIFKPGCPAVVQAQPERTAQDMLCRQAQERGALLSLGGRDWCVHAEGAGFHYRSAQRAVALPAPKLLGVHQYENAGLALAMLEAAGYIIPDAVLADALQQVTWPARLQRLTRGPLVAMLPAGWELWLDGGHNDSAGVALAAQAARWSAADEKPLLLICGMLNTKRPSEFFAPLAPYTARVTGISIAGETKTLSAESILAAAREVGIRDLATAPDVRAALQNSLSATYGAGRVLITGSLYLAGQILAEND